MFTFELYHSAFPLSALLIAYGGLVVWTLADSICLLRCAGQLIGFPSHPSSLRPIVDRSSPRSSSVHQSSRHSRPKVRNIQPPGKFVSYPHLHGLSPWCHPFRSASLGSGPPSRGLFMITLPAVPTSCGIDDIIGSSFGIFKRYSFPQLWIRDILDLMQERGKECDARK